MSQPPASAVRTLRTAVAKPGVQRAAAALAPVATSRPVAAPPPSAPASAPEEPREINVLGPRKLVRPQLPESVLRNRRVPRRDEPVLWRPSMGASVAQESTHAESFYFQKQMQSQTAMVFVLEDGEKIEGCVEWYDRNAIKVRGSRHGETGMRALIYKSSIKYLYKAGENSGQL